MVEVRTDIAYIKKDLAEIKTKLDTFIDASISNFTKKQEVEDLKKEVSQLSKKVRALELKWAYATGIAIFIFSIIQILIQVFGGKIYGG